MTTIELLQLDPKLLRLGPNVRTAAPDKALVASIKERGVLEPIVAYREEDAYVVLYGARRTLGAVQAKRTTVPVMLVDKPAETDRLVDQLSENEHRQSLTTLERVGAYEQMAALGLSPAQIAKRTASKRPEVDASLAIASSAAARNAVSTHALTLDQAVALTEFDDDPDVVKMLVLAADRGQFDHQVAYQRNRRADRLRYEAEEAEAAALIARTSASLTAAGHRVIDEPGHHDEPGVALVSQLSQDDEPLTEETHQDCPGAAVYLRTDWAFDDDDDEDGTQICVAEGVCTDYEANGHVLGRPRPGSPASSSSAAAEAGPAAPVDDRREVIANNRAWETAQGVRREWLRRFLARKTPPKGASLFIAESLGLAAYSLRDAMSDGNQLGHRLLGNNPFGNAQVPAYGPGKTSVVAQLMAGVSEGRAQVISLGLLLGAYEEAAIRDRWRTLDDTTQRYLRYIEGQGYALSAIEKRACGDA